MKVVKTVILIIILAALIGLTACGAYAYYIIHSYAEDINADDIYSLTQQKTVIYDSDGEEISSVSYTGGNRTLLESSQIPQNMKDAIVAIEDKTFWEHHGFNFIRMGGAIKEKLTGGGQISGTSTITQQLARNIYLSDTMSERSLKRKILEAYYTCILEKKLTKEQILEAYLNTVYFGYNSYGIQTAAENYFGKDAEDLDLIECAALAALPTAPDTNALVVTRTTSDGDDESTEKLKSKDGVTYLYNGNASENRRNLCLSLMESDGYITKAEKEDALSEDLKSHIEITVNSTKNAYGYFTDYAIEQVIDDMAEQLDLSEEEARQKVYTAGLKIYTSMDRDVQDVLSAEIENDDNYTGISYVPRDYDGNILNSDGDIILHPYSYYFEDGEIVFDDDEISEQDNGDLVIKKGRLSFIEVTSNGTTYVQPELSDMYVYENGELCVINGGCVNVPPGYTSLDSDGNCIVSAELLEEYPDFIKKTDEGYAIGEENCKLEQKAVQPQAAAVIIDNKTGNVVAMSGGRGGTGEKLYNRAVNPRQPGSSIKPIAVYGPALQISADLAEAGEEMDLESDGDNWGDYITAASIINDSATYVNGKRWPVNSYGGYRGQMTFRTALQQSVNVCAYKIFRQLDMDDVVDYLKKNGITSVVEDGEPNDMNASALALGGMTKGISPLELTAAYATFPNGGTYRTPNLYTKILDKDGNTVMEASQNEERVYDEGVAWIMTDILNTVVTKGIAGGAAIDGQPVGGKTGTTSNQYDIWFSGFTPQYTMALWEGNDMNLALTSSSSAAASFWSTIMGKVCEGLPEGSFSQMPFDVEKINGEYYVKGTGPKTSTTDIFTSEDAEIEDDESEYEEYEDGIEDGTPVEE